MPGIFVDGQDYTTSHHVGETTVGELLTNLMTSLAGAHKMISEVHLDGIALTEDSVHEVALRPIAGVQTVAVKTMTYRELTRFGLQRAVLLGQEVIRQAELAAERFRTAPQEEANRVYTSCLDDLQLLVDVVDQMLKLQDRSRTNGYHLQHAALGTHIHRLATVTGELLLAFRKNDVMLVADMLTYELVPHLKNMCQDLETLRNKLAH